LVDDDIRIGIFLCHCGVNIGGVINIPELYDFCQGLDNITFVGTSEFMCSSIGQNLIKKAINNYKLNRIIIASCSPKMHELTFRKLLKEVKLNPYLLEIVNIREQCSWCHSDVPKEATEKAKNLIKTASARVKNLEPLPTNEIGVLKKALVIGGGIAGMRAALDISKQGFPVYLLEKRPYLGGHLVQHSILYPNNSDPLKVYKEYVEEIEKQDIKIFSNSELEKVDGYIGNYKVKIKKNPKFVNDLCNLCGDCEEVCPIEVDSEFDQGLNKRKAIYIPFSSAFPNDYTIDSDFCTKCGNCLEVCKRNAINLRAAEETIDIDVGTIIVTTGFDIYEPVGEYGYGDFPDVVTLLQMERILSESGPTKGAILRPSDGNPPKRIIIIGCVGSREPTDVNTPRHYCSRICCSSIMVNSTQIKKNSPNMDVVVLYRDIRTHGRGHESLYTQARKTGVKFIRYSVRNKPTITFSPENNAYLVKVYDNSLQTNFVIPCDLIVLASAMIPSETTEELVSKLRITTSQDGFLQELHPKLSPLNTISEGIYIAGTAQAPKDIIDTVAQASGAAAKALIPIKQGKVILESAIANICESLCSGCGICEESCVFNAIRLENVQSRRIAKVIKAACKGCGVCGASCPSGAITMLNYTDEQMNSALQALLKTS